MRDKLIIIGAGGHGRVAADIARLVGYSCVEFLDDAPKTAIPTLGGVEQFRAYLSTHDFFVAIGSNAVREQITSMLTEAGVHPVSLVHPNAVIGSEVQIGEGTVVMAGAVINTGAVIGRGAILNTCCSVDHDCTVASYVHISVGAHLAGTVSVGERTMIGAGATVINNLTITRDCMIGAGAVVTKNILESGTYVGIPARRK